MSERAATEHGPSEPSADAGGPLRLYAAPGAVRRGRFLALFLLVNWGVMGAYVLSQGIRSLVGGLAFVLGLFALIGGLTHLRAARQGAAVPIAELTAGTLRYRRYSSTAIRSLELREIDAVLGRERDAVSLRLRDGSRVAVPWLTLSAADRELLGDRLDEHARS